MASKGIVVHDRNGNVVLRRIVAGSMKVYVSDGDGETGNPLIDIVPGGIEHAELAGLTVTANPHGANLGDLDDVNVASPTDKDVLTWDDATSKWTSQTTGGGDPPALSVEDPQDGDAYKIAYAPQAMTLKRATFRTMSGSVTFNMEIRDVTTPESSGTGVWTAGPKTADGSSAGNPVSTFDNAAVAQYNILVAKVISTSSAGTFYLDVVWEMDA
ncbi:MAG: hypothetical protein ACE5HE_08765 [Phycisphaerae bacterium]